VAAAETHACGADQQVQMAIPHIIASRRAQQRAAGNLPCL